jgi:hypothetical protein
LPPRVDRRSGHDREILDFGDSPKGRTRWTPELLEDQVVERGIVACASDDTVGRTQKNVVKPHLNQNFVTPPPPSQGQVPANAPFVANMEDVLEVYHRPRDPAWAAGICSERSSAAVARPPKTGRKGNGGCRTESPEKLPSVQVAGGRRSTTQH